MSAASRSTGRLEAVWLKRGHGGPMDPAETARLDENGLVGNANRGGRRAVTVIEREVFERVRAELGEEVRPEMRRANLMISGLTLEGSRGRLLAIGECRVRVGGETRPCLLMDEEGFPGLQAALEPRWGGGVFGRVEVPGEIAVGDPVFWAD